LCICLCFFLGRMTARLWGQSVWPESSPASKRLPSVAALNSPHPIEDNIERSPEAETATLNSPDPTEDSRLDSIGPQRRVKAFLDTIAAAEGTASPDGYRTVHRHHICQLSRSSQGNEVRPPLRQKTLFRRRGAISVSQHHLGQIR
jgi:hypothetical protein